MDEAVMLIDIINAEKPGAELADDGCQSDPHYPHPKRHGKENVQHNIDNAGNQQKEERCPGIPEPLKDAGVDVKAQASDQPDKDDDHIGSRHLQGAVVRHVHETEQRIRRKNADQGQRDDADQHGGIERADGPADLAHIFCAVKLGDHYRGPGADSDEQGAHHKNDGKARANCGKGFFPDPVADHNAVDHVIKLLKDIAHQQRD